MVTIKHAWNVLLPLLLAACWLPAAVQVTDVAVSPRWPWNGKVDITYSITCTGDDAQKQVMVTFSGVDREHGQQLALTTLTGDGVARPLRAGGPYHTVWDAGKDAPGLHTTAFRVRIHAEVHTQQVSSETYLVIDLSGGPDAEHYPVRYTSIPPLMHLNTIRTTELWLRRIPAGSFMMGSPVDELGHQRRETQHQVVLTEVFYLGIFECTQKQWELVMGNNPAYFKGDMRPVEQVQYQAVRGSSPTGGAGWPAYWHRVDPNSFMGRLQAKTGLTFDLPTEAQWEYACRAGTPTSLNSGLDIRVLKEDPFMAEVGRYSYNAKDGKGKDEQGKYEYTQHTKVGLYRANNWGLYDMHGNVWEWCLDWFAEEFAPDAVTDPEGPATGSHRVLRGGDWQCPAQHCRSAYGVNLNPGGVNRTCSAGFRVAFLP